MSKGSNRRPTDEKAFSDNYDSIFGKSPLQDAQKDIDALKLIKAIHDEVTTTTIIHTLQ